MWYILLPATSLVFSSLLSLPSTVPSTTKQHKQKVGKWGIQEKEFHWTSLWPSLVVCRLGRVEKSQICQIRRWLPSAISELAGGLSLCDPYFWTKTDRALVLVAKLAYFMCSKLCLWSQHLKKIFWAPDQHLWKCRNSAEMAEDRRKIEKFILNVGG